MIIASQSLIDGSWKRLSTVLSPGSQKDERPSVAIDTSAFATAGYYFGWDHGLVQRHLEAVALNSDQSARWELTIDFELPSSPRASFATFDGQDHFFFPLLFLKKAQGRTGFGVYTEDETVLPIPTQAQCDAASIAGALATGRRLLSDTAPEKLQEELETHLRRIVTRRPLKASAALAKLEQDLDCATRKSWHECGLLEDLHMLVEHSVIWMPFRGIPGERRLLRVRQDHEFTPRPFVRWIFGELKEPKFPRLRRRRARLLQDGNSTMVLYTGSKTYGRRRYSVSLSVLGERLLKALAWMPIEFDFPSIYPRRCASYHFELTCPDGLAPRDVKLAIRKERHWWERHADIDESSAKQDQQLTLRAGRAHVYLSGGSNLNEIKLRVTAGVSPGAFPILWFFASATTAIMLWTLAAVDPTSLTGEGTSGKDQIAAGVLLVVPALLGGLIFGVESRSISRLLNGARVLLLVSGLSAVGAATVLIRQPFGLQCGWAWTICATIATVATVPLATSWLLSVPTISHQLGKLDTVERQYQTLVALGLLAELLLLGLLALGHAPLLRAAGGAALVLMVAPFILLASNRGAVSILIRRSSVVIPAATAAAICLALGCIELHGTTDPQFVREFAGQAEIVGMLALFVVLISGIVLLPILKPSDFTGDELNVPPDVGRALIAGDRIYELVELRKYEEAV
ncbi:MAG TPA: hypothetical protein VF245_07325 [Solirubrobacterales bacterium]